MIRWDNNEDLAMLFAKCRESTNGSDDFAVLIISQFGAHNNTDGHHYEVVCTFFPDEDARMKRDEVQLFTLDEEFRFKSANRAVVQYSMEYIMNTLKVGKKPSETIFIVSDLGNPKDVVRKQISKKHAKMNPDLELVRTVLLKNFNLIQVIMDKQHPYRLTARQLFSEKRKRQEERQKAAQDIVAEMEIPENVQ